MIYVLESFFFYRIMMLLKTRIFGDYGIINNRYMMMTHDVKLISILNSYMMNGKG